MILLRCVKFEKSMRRARGDVREAAGLYNLLLRRYQEAGEI